MIKSLTAAVLAALTTAFLAITPARAATATFPIVQDCSPFADFYSSWQKLPHDLYATGTYWVPQGLAYDPAHQWLLTSYYDGRSGVAAADKYPSMLVATTLDGNWVKTLYFNTNDVDRGGHAGGLAVGKGNLYVASTEHGPRVTRIPLLQLGRTPNNGTLSDFPTVDLAAASYASFAEGKLYVGDFEHNLLYSYDTNPAGVPDLDSQISYPTPTLVQGLAVSDRQFLYTRSYGRTRLSYLTAVDRRSGSSQDTVLPNMAEGTTWAPAGERSAQTDLYVLFESGSAAYGPDSPGGASTCVTPQLWHRNLGS